MNQQAATISPLGPLGDMELPRLAPLSKNLFAACFSVMKLLPARYILERAMERGELDESTHVVESTSGTFGLALAMLKPYYGYDLTLVSDPVIDPLLLTKLHDLEANVEIVQSPTGGGYQKLRLAKVEDLRASLPKTFFPSQYFNPDNQDGYKLLAEYLAARLGQVDALIGTVGTGGSMSGTAKHLRKQFPHLEVIGVDTFNSVIFGQPDGSRPLRGLGNSLVPGNVDHRAFDQVHWVTAAEGFKATRMLHSRHALFMGPTSGAAWIVAAWYARLNPEKRVAVIFPDEGYRYQHTVYSDEWLKGVPGWDERELPTRPMEIYHPSFVRNYWSYFQWNRQSREEALAGF